jgi:hypothetical protein
LLHVSASCLCCGADMEWEALTPRVCPRKKCRRLYRRLAALPAVAESHGKTALGCGCIACAKVIADYRRGLDESNAAD